MPETTEPLEGIIIPATDESGSLVSIGTPNPEGIFTDEAVIRGILAQISDRAKDFTPNLTTKAGRQEIASRARRVASTKVFLDGIGKDLVAELKSRPARIDAGRKLLRDGLEALQTEIRAKLDAYEARQADLKAKLDFIYRLPATLIGHSLSQIEPHIGQMALLPTDEESWGEFQAEAVAAKTQALAALNDLAAKAEKAEADALELVRLREESERRAQKDREEQIRKDAEEKAKKEAAEATRAREEKAKRDAAESKLAQERAEQAQRDAEARLVQEQAAAAQREELARQQATEAERRRQEQAVRALEAQKELERQESERLAQDKEHRREFNQEALADTITAMSNCPAVPDEATWEEELAIYATSVLTAIVTGKVRHITIEY